MSPVSVRVVPLPAVGAALRGREYALEAQKHDGITLRTNYRAACLHDDAFDPLFAEINRPRIPIFVHPATPAVRELPRSVIPSPGTNPRVQRMRGSRQ